MCRSAYLLVCYSYPVDRSCAGHGTSAIALRETQTTRRERGQSYTLAGYTA
jgi:hypothetical protein